MTRHQEQQRAQDATDATDRDFHDMLWAAEQRDRAAGETDCPADTDSQAQALSRQLRAVDREHNQWDRAALRNAWIQMRKDQTAAQTDAAAAQQDRLQAQRDRQASADDRTAAQADRLAAQADREQAIVEDQQRQPPWRDEIAHDDLPSSARTSQRNRAVHDMRQQAEEAVRRGEQAHHDAVAAHHRVEQMAQRLSDIQARWQRTIDSDEQATSQRPADDEPEHFQ
ncbi:hypothetical protein Psi01_85070 [Planobispora siamensis]|uniref:Uncharacterized protein n=1 Tax=Planobispora siamensis TaxID=936338 RepID=A0A8J3WRA0_9ACTN|nr:hypothetical protein Psi01_85070 [Planobispora siamensis]